MGPRKPTDERVSILLTIKKKTLDILGKKAVARGQSRNRLINEMIELGLDLHMKQNGK
jgi:hypothetical protein